jgi:dCTP diphosphatase
MGDAIELLRQRLRQFASDRDWDQFHSPKNLAIALSVEAGELLEHFQWFTAEQSANLSETELSKKRIDIRQAAIRW